MSKQHTNASANKNDSILEHFKTTFCTEGSGIVDAWLVGSGEDTLIEYQLDIALSDLEPEELLKKINTVPSVFEGLSTMITWFPRVES